MAAPLNDAIRTLFEDERTVKVLATTDANGRIHAVVKQSLSLDGDGNIVLWEFLESATSNKNLLYGLWHDKPVAVLLAGPDGVSYGLTGRPVRSIVAGPRFQDAYQKLRQRRGDVDLAAVWIIEPEEAVNETFAVRQAEENAAHPLFRHLDRLVRHPGN